MLRDFLRFQHEAVLALKRKGVLGVGRLCLTLVRNPVTVNGDNRYRMLASVSRSPDLACFNL